MEVWGSVYTSENDETSTKNNRQMCLREIEKYSLKIYRVNVKYLMKTNFCIKKQIIIYAIMPNRNTEFSTINKL